MQTGPLDLFHSDRVQEVVPEAYFMIKSGTSHQRIVVSLTSLQNHVRAVDRITGTAVEPELGRWTDLAKFLSDLYIQMQHQKQVTIYRSGNKNSD